MGGRGKELLCKDWVITQYATARAGLVLVQSLCMCRLVGGGVRVEVRGACCAKTGSSPSVCCFRAGCILGSSSCVGGCRLRMGVRAYC